MQCNWAYYRSLRMCEELNDLSASISSAAGVTLFPRNTRHVALFVHVPLFEHLPYERQVDCLCLLVRELVVNMLPR